MPHQSNLCRRVCCVSGCVCVCVCCICPCREDVFKIPQVVAIGKAHQKSAAQVYITTAAAAAAAAAPAAAAVAEPFPGFSDKIEVCNVRVHVELRLPWQQRGHTVSKAAVNQPHGASSPQAELPCPCRVSLGGVVCARKRPLQRLPMQPPSDFRLQSRMNPIA